MSKIEEYPFYPELTEEGKLQAQALMVKFEETLKASATKIISEFSTEFYCDVLNEIESDHWANYRTKILNALCDYRNKPNNKHDFDRIRLSIWRNHKEEIIKDLNQDLIKEITDLKEQLTKSNQRFGYY